VASLLPADPFHSDVACFKVGHKIYIFHILNGCFLTNRQKTSKPKIREHNEILEHVLKGKSHEIKWVF
jgi:hypothetical protein